MEYNRIVITTATVFCFISLMFSGCKDGGGEINIVGSNARIVMFSSDSPQAGGFGNRATADSYCMSSINKPPGYPNIRAMVSFDASDDIFLMKPNFGIPGYDEIKSPNGGLVFDDWGHLTSPMGPHATLYDLGILPNGSTWWSGSLSDGRIAAENCTNWTATGMVRRGSSNASDALWINNGSESCIGTSYLLCLAF